MSSRFVLAAALAAAFLLAGCIKPSPTRAHFGAAGTGWVDMSDTPWALLFNREVSGLPLQSFASPDGRYSGRAFSQTGLSFVPAQGITAVPTVTGTLADGEVFECALHPGKVAPGERIFNTITQLAQVSQILSVVPVDVQVISGRPFYVVEIVYSVAKAGISRTRREDTIANKDPGDYQIAFYTRAHSSIICTHDGAGFRETFLRSSHLFVESLRDTQEAAAPAVRYSSLSVARFNGHVAGYSEVAQLPDESDGNASTSTFTTLMVPGKEPATPAMSDLDRFDLFDADHTLVRAGAALYRTGEWTELKLQRAAELEYEVMGKQAGAPVEGLIHARIGLRDVPSAERLAVANGKQEEAKFESWNPAHPLTAQARAYRGLLATLSLGELSLDDNPAQLIAELKLDANGAVIDESEHVGKEIVLDLTRVWSSGTPR